MGKKRYYNISAQRAMPDEMIPDPHKTAVIESGVTGVDISDIFEEQLFTGAYLKFDRMYRYAAKGDYYWGLPDTRLTRTDSANALIETVIEAEVGQSISLYYAFHDTYNNVHLAYKALQETYGFDEVTNELATLSTARGFPVYLENIIPYFQGTYGDGNDTTNNYYWDRSPKAGYTPNRASRESGEATVEVAYDWEIGEELTEGALVVYTWQDDEREIHEASFFIDMSTYDKDGDYYQAKYSYGTGENKVIKYWVYTPGTGTYPALDSFYDRTGQAPYMAEGDYFPIIPFREFWEDLSDPALAGTPKFDTTVEILRLLNMDYEEIGAAIHENPDIDKVIQANLFMGIPIDSENQIDRSYLFRFFSDLYQRTPAPPPMKAKDFQEQYFSQRPGNTFDFYDAGFAASFTYTGIKRRIKAGVLSTTLGHVDVEIEVTRFTTEDLVLLPIINLHTPRQEDRVNVSFRKQISIGMYEEILVEDLSMRYWTGSLAFNAPVNIQSPLPSFLIPINRNLTADMDFRDKYRLYYRSLNFIFLSETTVETEWYESGPFKALITVVGIVLIVLTYQYELLPYLTAAWAAGYAAFALAVSYLIVVQIALKYAFKLIVKEIGIEAAMVLAIVALTVGLSNEGVGQDSWAGTLVQASSGLITTSQDVLGDMFKELQADMSATAELQKELLDELQEKNDLLNSTSGIDPMIFTRLEPFTVFGEDPNDFYNRTIHNENPGVLAFDLMENYFENSLRLPTIQDTLGEIA